MDTSATEVPAKPSSREDEIKHLFTAIGEISEHLKQLSLNTADLPKLTATVNDLKTQMEIQMADMQARVLMAEESVMKMQDMITSDGKKHHSIQPKKVSRPPRET